MTLRLSPDMLRAAYEFLCTTHPFKGWNLPDGEDVVFSVAKDPRNFAWHSFDGNRHSIAVSESCVGHTNTLMETMAHEMVHLHEHHTGATKRGGRHSAAFDRWSAEVCKSHGFDPKSFY